MAKNKTAKRTEARRAKSQSEQGGKFKVLRGAHVVGSKVYPRGSIVESDQDLVERFKDEGRFKRVGGVGLQSAETEDEDDDDEEEDVTATSKAAAVKNPKGAHDRSLGATEIEEDEEDDEEESDDEESDDDDEEEGVAASAQSDDEEEEEEEDDEEEEEDEGEDVTSDFKKEAKAAGATVTKVGKTYTLADKKGNVIGKKSGYTRKDDVKAALKKAAK